MLTPTRIQNSFLKLRPNTGWSFHNVGRSETNAFTHGYHRYPAKFIPHIVRKLITDYTSPGELVCDPFGGCGTTLVESKLLGRPSIGFDINPIAKLITQTKTTPIKSKTLYKCKEKFLKKYYSAPSTEFKHHPKINYWFDDTTLRELDKIYFAIKQIKNYKIRRLLLCTFSHILKNCSRWLMKSIKPTIDPVKIIPKPLDVFLQHFNFMARKNEQFYAKLFKSGNLETPAKMYRCDSTRKLPLKSNSVDLIITSPPYVTSYEYADLHQLSLLWFGDDPNHFKKWHKFSRQFDDFRKKFIGTSYKKEKNGDYGSAIAQQIVNKLSITDVSLAVDIANYFLDMKKVFLEMYRILKVGAKACVVIGNTNLRGVEILNTQVVAEQMSNIGFRKVKFIKREVLNKMITPWRDSKNGKFTSLNNPLRKRVYEFEYIVIMRK